MIQDIYQKLEWRLRSICKADWQSHKGESDCSQCSLLYVELFMANGQAIGWLKPEIKPLEPRNLNPVDLELESVLDWSHVIAGLRKRSGGILIIQRGEPIGWI